MYSKKMAALVAASVLVVTSSVASAQSASSLTPARATATIEDSSRMGTPGDERYAGGFWVAILGAALLGAFLLIVLDDEDDLPDSP